MSKFLQTIIIGVVSGCLYSLLAMGMVLVYRTTGVLNIAHGGVGVLSGFISWDLITKRDFPYVPGVVCGVLFAVVLGLVFERFVIRPLPHAGARTVATLGLFLLTQGVIFAMPKWSNNSAQIFPSPLAGESVEVPAADYNLSYDQLILMGSVVVFFVGLTLLLKRTNLGLAMRAVSDDPAAARLMGVREQLISPVVWTLAFGISAVSVMLIAPIQLLDNGYIVSLTLKALAVTFVGGLVSIPLTLVGALTLGLLESFSDIYYADIEGLKDAWPFILMVLVLLVRLARPTKALGEEALARA